MVVFHFTGKLMLIRVMLYFLMMLEFLRFVEINPFYNIPLRLPSALQPLENSEL